MGPERRRFFCFQRGASTVTVKFRRGRARAHVSRVSRNIECIVQVEPLAAALG